MRFFYTINLFFSLLGVIGVLFSYLFVEENFFIFFIPRKMMFISWGLLFFSLLGWIYVSKNFWAQFILYYRSNLIWYRFLKKISLLLVPVIFLISVSQYDSCTLSCQQFVSQAKKVLTINEPLEIELRIYDFNQDPQTIVKIDYLLEQIGHPYLHYRKVALTKDSLKRIENLSSHSTNINQNKLVVRFNENRLYLNLDLLKRTVVDSHFLGEIVFDNLEHSLLRLFQQVSERAKKSANKELRKPSRIPRVAFWTSELFDEYSQFEAALFLAGIDLDVFENSKNFHWNREFNRQKYLSNYQLLIVDARTDFSSVPVLWQKIILETLQGRGSHRILLLLDPVLEKGPISGLVEYWIKQKNIRGFNNLVVDPRKTDFQKLNLSQYLTSSLISGKEFGNEKKQKYELSKIKSLVSHPFVTRTSFSNVLFFSNQNPVFRGAASFQMPVKFVRNDFRLFGEHLKSLSFTNKITDSYWLPFVFSHSLSWKETSLLGEVKEKNLHQNNLDEPGPLPVGWIWTQSKFSHRLVLLGDSDFLKNNFLGVGFNESFSVNLVRWMVAEKKKLVPRLDPKFYIWSFALEEKWRYAEKVGYGFLVSLFVLWGIFLWIKLVFKPSRYNSF